MWVYRVCRTRKRIYYYSTGIQSDRRCARTAEINRDVIYAITNAHCRVPAFNGSAVISTVRVNGTNFIRYAFGLIVKQSSCYDSSPRIYSLTFSGKILGARYGEGFYLKKKIIINKKITIGIWETFRSSTLLLSSPARFFPIFDH